MRCSGCGADYAPGTRFCQACGGRLVAECAACHAETEASAAYCGSCGTAIATALSAAAGSATPMPSIDRLVPREFAERLLATRGRTLHERRLVTILFADIAGSTAMAERLDPEDVLEIVNGAFEHLIAPVYGYEGTVAELRGDGILAFFGAPIGHEDDPQRAVRAALDIQAGVREYATRLAAERGIEQFAARVGINTGLVVVGEVGSDLRIAYTAVGDAINMAARMEQNAPPGGILVSAETFGHVADDFTADRQPPLAVKGHADPMDTYLISSSRASVQVARPRRVAGLETRLIGREAELAEIASAVERSLAGDGGSILLLVGEPGIGKSRLLAEALAAATRRADAPDAWMGRATAATTTTPYGLLRDLWARRAGVLDSDTASGARERFERHVAAAVSGDPSALMRAHVIGHLLGFDLSASPYLSGQLGDPRQVRDRALAYLAEDLRARAAVRPIVLALEDLHWADDSSLDALPGLAAALADRPVLLLATARPTLDERRPGWTGGSASVQRLSIGPLAPSAGEALATELLHRAESVPDALRDLVVGRAGGNPFFAEELVRMLLEDGVIEQLADRGDTWRVRSDLLGEVRVPLSLTGVLQARMDRLPPAERAMLQRASVVGRRFWDRALLRLASMADGAADDTDPLATAATLSSLERRELVFERQPSTFEGSREYVFKHALVRDVAYEGLLRRQRRAYHGAIADWLVEIGGDRADEIAGLVGSHLELAGRAEEAARHLARAGARAAAAFANVEAIDLYRRALRLVGDPSGDARTAAFAAERAEELGNVLHRVGSHAEAREAYARALALVPVEASVDLARLDRLIGNTLVAERRFREADAAFDRAAAELGPGPETIATDPDRTPPSSGARDERAIRRWREWLALQNDRMVSCYFSNRPDEIDAIAAQTGPLVERWGSPSERAGYFNAIVMLALRRHRYVVPRSAVEDARRMLAASQEPGLPDRLAWPWFMVGFASLWHGDLGTAAQALATSLEIGERTGDVSLEARCLTYLAVVARMQGDAGRVAALIPRCEATATAADMPEYLATARANKAWLAWRAGDLDAAERLGRAALGLIPTTLDLPFRWLALWPLIGVAVARGDVEAAVAGARELLAPSQQRIDDELLVPIERALRAWDDGDVSAAGTSLAAAAGLARATGRL